MPVFDKGDSKMMPIQGLGDPVQNNLTVSSGFDILSHWNFYRYKPVYGAATGLISNNIDETHMRGLFHGGCTTQRSNCCCA